jgi:hypothetical protein
MKYYIDAGANIGTTLDLFFTKYPDPEGFNIILFECNPDLIPTLKDSVVRTRSRISVNSHKWVTSELKRDFFNAGQGTIKEEAVWIRDGEVDFYLDKKGRSSLGSTLIKEKQS